MLSYLEEILRNTLLLWVFINGQIQINIYLDLCNVSCSLKKHPAKASEPQFQPNIIITLFHCLNC